MSVEWSDLTAPDIIDPVIFINSRHSLRERCINVNIALRGDTVSIAVDIKKVLILCRLRQRAHDSRRVTYRYGCSGRIVPQPALLHIEVTKQISIELRAYTGLKYVFDSSPVGFHGVYATISYIRMSVLLFEAAYHAVILLHDS